MTKEEHINENIISWRTSEWLLKRTISQDKVRGRLNSCFSPTDDFKSYQDQWFQIDYRDHAGQIGVAPPSALNVHMNPNETPKCWPASTPWPFLSPVRSQHKGPAIIHDQSILWKVISDQEDRGWGDLKPLIAALVKILFPACKINNRFARRCRQRKVLH